MGPMRLSFRTSGTTALLLSMTAAMGCGKATKAPPAPTCVAKIADICIERKMLKPTFRFVTLRGPEQLRDAKGARYVLDGVIDRELLAKAAAKEGITVTDAEVDAAVAKDLMYVSLPGDMPPPQLGLDAGVLVIDDIVPEEEKQKKEEGMSDEEAFERWIKVLAATSPEEFKAWQKRELLAWKMKQRVREQVKVTDEDAFATFVAERTTATVDHVDVKRTWVEKYALKVDDKDADAWAAEHPERLMVPVRHILVAGTTPEELAAAKAKAQGLLDRIKKGEDFAELAKENSDDPGSKENGGMYPAEQVGGFVPEFRETVRKLKPGEVAPDLVKTSFGYHVIKRDPATHDVIVKGFHDAKRDELVSAMALEIQAAAKDKPLADAAAAVVAKYAKTPAARADADRPKVETTRPFTRGEKPFEVFGPEGQKAFNELAFDAEPNKLAEKPFHVIGGVAVVQAKGHVPPTKEEFAKERDTYVVQILPQKQREAVLAYLKSLRVAVKDQVTIDEDRLWPRDGGAPDGGS